MADGVEHPSPAGRRLSWPVIFDENSAWVYGGGDVLPMARPYRDYIAWLHAASDRDGESSGVST